MLQQPSSQTKAPAWCVVGSSITGVSHLHTGQECQDAHCWQETEDGRVVAAVADGSGSAALGGEGAKVAVRAAVASLANTGFLIEAEQDSMREIYLKRALHAAREAVLEEAARLNRAPSELATTLIVLLLSPNWVATAQIGDGAVIVADSTGCLVSLTPPKSIEYINETVFITMESSIEKAADICVWKGFATHVAAFTDGLQRLALKMPSGEPHGPFFAPLFRFVSTVTEPSEATLQLETFLRSPRISERADDDLTLLLAARHISPDVVPEASGA